MGHFSCIEELLDIPTYYSFALVCWRSAKIYTFEVFFFFFGFLGRQF